MTRERVAELTLYEPRSQFQGQVVHVARARVELECGCLVAGAAWGSSYRDPEASIWDWAKSCIEEARA